MEFLHLGTLMDTQFSSGRKKVEPWPATSLLGRLSFAYVTPLVEKGLKKPLEETDLWVRFDTKSTPPARRRAAS